MFGLVGNPNAFDDFHEAFGVRFPFLDDSGVATYNDYAIPDPEAPYPHDFIIDQQGIVRYWSWEYEPQQIISVIEGLLASTAVDDQALQPGAHLMLSAPQPSPFRTQTVVRFRIAAPGRVSLSVTDAGGRLVRSLFDGWQTAGEHAARWQGEDGAGQPVAGGVYYLVLSGSAGQTSRRVVFIP